MSHALVGFLAFDIVLAPHYYLLKSTHSSGLPKAEVKAETRYQRGRKKSLDVAGMHP